MPLSACGLISLSFAFLGLERPEAKGCPKLPRMPSTPEDFRERRKRVIHKLKDTAQELSYLADMANDMIELAADMEAQPPPPTPEKNTKKGKGRGPGRARASGDAASGASSEETDDDDQCDEALEP